MTENMKIVLNGPRMASVRDEIRAPSSTIFTNKEWRKEEDPVSLPNETRRHSKSDGKGETKGKDPKKIVRQESRTSWCATIFHKRKCQKESACEYWHPPECAHHKSKSGCK